MAGDAALLFDPTNTVQIADALRRLLADTALAADLVRRGHERCARFSWAEAARGTLAAYQRRPGLTSGTARHHGGIVNRRGSETPRVLFVSSGHDDFLSDGLLHGLRTLLGPGVVDWPRVDHMYADYPAERRPVLHGKGFTLAGLLEGDRAVDRTRAPLSRLRRGVRPGRVRRHLARVRPVHAMDAAAARRRGRDGGDRRRGPDRALPVVGAVVAQARVVVPAAGAPRRAATSSAR